MNQDEIERAFELEAEMCNAIDSFYPIIGAITGATTDTALDERDVVVALTHKLHELDVVFSEFGELLCQAINP